MGSGSFDGADSFFEGGVEEGVDYGVRGEFSVGEVAAAEAPRGARDLDGEVFFDHVHGFERTFYFEGASHVGDEEVVDFGLFGEDEIVVSPEAVGYGVLGGGVMPFRGTGSGGLGRVTAVRVDLSFGGHGLNCSLSEGAVRALSAIE